MRKIGRRILQFAIVGTSVLVVVTGSPLASDKILNVSASVHPTEVGLNDTFLLTVRVETENINTVPKPELTELEHFTKLSEQSRTETKISIINGKTTRTKTVSYTYTLKPKRKGSFTIDPITVQYKDRAYRTNPITITVVEQSPQSDDSSYIVDDETPVDLNRLKEDIFVLVTPQKPTVYVGEQILLTYTLFSRVDIDSISLKQSPDFPGFYKEDIFNAVKLENKRQNYRGKVYNTSLLKKLALFPLKPGNVSPSSLALDTTIIIKPEDLFSFFGRPFNFTVESPPLSIRVKPLPALKPESRFDHITGELEIELSKRANTVQTGEAMPVYLTFKSTGNLNMIADPDIQLTKRGRVYLSDTKIDRVHEEDKIYFIKKFEYTIIPEESGTLTVSAKEYLYFNIEKETYETAKAEPIQATIAGKDIYGKSPIKTTKKRHSEGGLLYIKNDMKILKSIREIPLNPTGYFFYHVILVSVTVGLFLFKLKRERLEKNQKLFRKKRAYSQAKALLASSIQLLNSGDLEAAIDRIYRALFSFVAHKSERTPQEVSMKNIEKLLNESFKINGDQKKEILDILERCTLHKFSLKTDDTQTIKNLHDRAVSVIREIESMSG